MEGGAREDIEEAPAYDWDNIGIGSKFLVIQAELTDTNDLNLGLKVNREEHATYPQINPKSLAALASCSPLLPFITSKSHCLFLISLLPKYSSHSLSTPFSLSQSKFSFANIRHFMTAPRHLSLFLYAF